MFWRARAKPNVYMKTSASIALEFFSRGDASTSVVKLQLMVCSSCKRCRSCNTHAYICIYVSAGSSVGSWGTSVACADCRTEVVEKKQNLAN